MIQSNGVVTKSAVAWTGSPTTWPGWGSITLQGRFASYDQIYREVGWIRTVIDKRATALARLPLKVYRRISDDERESAGDNPYGMLLRQPNERMSAHAFWLWMSTTYDIYGEAFAGKVRDAGGRPVQLVPLHPACMSVVDEGKNDPGAETFWRFSNGRVEFPRIPERDLFHPKNYNPSSSLRGLSKLESLRNSIEADDASRRSTKAFWNNGARLSGSLEHPGKLSPDAGDRLRLNWQNVHGGVDNAGKVAILEEGMRYSAFQSTNEQSQYIDTRKLERDEMISGYDVPPPAVHVLDRATFSNIVEQFRSLYRDTIASLVHTFEAELETQIRAAPVRRGGPPDFSDDIYAEFMLDEVLRGDFEQRVTAYQAAINSGWLMPSEVRAMENKPFVEGSDRLLVNSTIIPLEEALKPKPEPAPPGMVPTPALPAGSNGNGQTVPAR